MPKVTDDELWRTIREEKQFSAKTYRTGALNFALLFGIAVVALSLILTPMLSKTTGPFYASIQDPYDNITTGSIKKSDHNGRTYTLRRSVMLDSPGSVCVLGDGDTSDGC